MTYRIPRERNLLLQIEPLVFDLEHAQFAPAAAAKAELDLDSENQSTNCDTVIRAKTPGAAGNAITIEFVQSGSVANGGALDESGFPALVFTFKNGVTTVANFETAVGGSTYIEVKTTGTANDTLATGDDEFGPSSLAGGSDAGSSLLALWATPESRKVRIDSVQYVNPTGLAAHGTDWVTLHALIGNVAIRRWSTKSTGAEGGITANTPVLLSDTGVDAVMQAGDVLSLRLLAGDGQTSYTGTPTLPPGRFIVEGRYV